ncbi:MAG: 4Fe-4S binding protein [Candidatus Hermodarchaeota archaeon]
MPGVKGYVAVIGEALRNLVRPNVTVLFPVEHTEVPPGYRGAPEVDPDLCTVCRICERECPTHTIQINGPIEAPDTPPDKDAYEFTLNYSQCMFCQTCEEFCPQGKKGTPAIVLTNKWLLAAYSTDDTVYRQIVYKKKSTRKED